MISCSQKKHAVDMLVINANIYTVDDAMQVAEAMAINSGKVIAVGTAKELLNTYTSDHTLDADGKAIYPGFYDAHCHFYHYGKGLIHNADLRGMSSFQSVVKQMQDFAADKPDGWLAGRGWDQNLWPDKSMPDNTLLNNAFPDRPVILTRIDGHAVVANNIALEKAGITASTIIDGGEVVVKNGVPTGLLIDKAGDKLKDMCSKAFAERENSRDDIIKGVLLAQKNCFTVGLTSVVDAGLEAEEVLLLDSLDKNGKLLIKVNAMLHPTQQNYDLFMINGPFIGDHIHVRSVKFYADGALGSRGALLKRPYTDKPEKQGLLLTPVEEMRKWFIDLYNLQYQVCTHAIGDSANKLVLQLYSEVLREKNDFRWRIEHAQVVSPTDISLFKEFSIIPAVNTVHATSDMYWAEERLGERIEHAYAYKNLLQQNGWLPNGSDFPIEQINPLYGFFAAVERKDNNYYPPKGFYPEQRLSREDALRAMTIWAAKASFEEKNRGSLEPGKDADFVMLDIDIMQCKPEQIPLAKVLKTFSNGVNVFSIEK